MFIRFCSSSLALTFICRPRADVPSCFWAHLCQVQLRKRTGALCDHLDGWRVDESKAWGQPAGVHCCPVCWCTPVGAGGSRSLRLVIRQRFRGIRRSSDWTTEAQLGVVARYSICLSSLTCGVYESSRVWPLLNSNPGSLRTLLVAVQLPGHRSQALDSAQCDL